MLASSGLARSRLISSGLTCPGLAIARTHCLSSPFAGLALTTSRIRGWFDRTPREIWFAHPAQGPVDEYQKVLGCPVRFERDPATRSG